MAARRRQPLVPPDPIKLTHGEMLRILREAAELTQSELARRARVAQPRISAIEQGREPMTLERAKTLARALKVPEIVLAFPDLVDQLAAVAAARDSFLLSGLA